MRSAIQNLEGFIVAGTAPCMLITHVKLPRSAARGACAKP